MIGARTGDLNHFVESFRLMARSCLSKKNRGSAGKMIHLNLSVITLGAAKGRSAWAAKVRALLCTITSTSASESFFFPRVSTWLLKCQLLVTCFEMTLPTFVWKI
jgi:hypothetical protein